MSKRMPPLKPDDLSPELRARHDTCFSACEKGFQDQFTWRTPENALLGPFPLFLRTRSSIAKAWLGFLNLGEHGLPPRRREIAILATGARYGAAFELYSHSRIAEKSAGMPRDQVLAYCAGKVPSEAPEDDKLAFEVASALGNKGPLPQELYERAVKAWGAEGFHGVVEYCQFYSAVAVGLNAYDVPVPPGEDLLLSA